MSKLQTLVERFKAAKDADDKVEMAMWREQILNCIAADLIPEAKELVKSIESSTETTQHNYGRYMQAIGAIDGQMYQIAFTMALQRAGAGPGLRAAAGLIFGSSAEQICPIQIKENRPKPGKLYVLTGSGKSIASGNTWEESETCIACEGTGKASSGLPCGICGVQRKADSMKKTGKVVESGTKIAQNDKAGPTGKIVDAQLVMLPPARSAETMKRTAKITKEAGLTAIEIADKKASTKKRNAISTTRSLSSWEKGDVLETKRAGCRTPLLVIDVYEKEGLVTLVNEAKEKLFAPMPMPILMKFGYVRTGTVSEDVLDTMVFADCPYTIEKSDGMDFGESVVTIAKVPKIITTPTPAPADPAKHASKKSDVAPKGVTGIISLGRAGPGIADLANKVHAALVKGGLAAGKDFEIECYKYHISAYPTPWETHDATRLGVIAGLVKKCGEIEIVGDSFLRVK